MKTVFSIILLSSLISSTALAQNNSVKPEISLDVVASPSQQTGNSNYLLSLSEEDFNNNKYVFYTDSNATVAYLVINGNNIRLTGGPNPEHIMAYVCKDYTITLRVSKSTDVNKNADDQDNLKIAATLVIYNNQGQSLVKKVIGTQINLVKK